RYSSAQERNLFSEDTIRRGCFHPEDSGGVGLDCSLFPSASSGQAVVCCSLFPSASSGQAVVRCLVCFDVLMC
ncbi:MAG: hypothetical protein M0P50_08065, partial [Bacteroidales bacterium]|nr:hypothetical protein [Bacteroidales bacterium]